MEHPELMKQVPDARVRLSRILREVSASLDRLGDEPEE